MRLPLQVHVPHLYMPAVTHYDFLLTAVCALFGVAGFIICFFVSFFLVTSTAAQAGAMAGLGTAFISKPLVYEVRRHCKGKGRVMGVCVCVWYA